MSRLPEPSRFQAISPAAERILSLGESDRYEFKRDIDAVTPKLLAALANWVALDPTREAAHLLVGVEEVEDAASGLTYGVPYGLPRGLDKGVARIQDVASKTRPIPVATRVIEEAVGEQIPFLRVEVRPTMAPHFDDEGRRQTRQGRSTRALTDDELLAIYLDREAGSFGMRFRQTTVELQEAVGAVGSQVDDIADAIREHVAEPIRQLARVAGAAEEAAMLASHAAEGASGAAMSAEWEAERVQRLVRELQETVMALDADSRTSIVSDLSDVRRWVWWIFTVDTYTRDSQRAAKLADRVLALLSRAIPIDPDQAAWEVVLWDGVLAKHKKLRRERATMKRWDAVTAEAERLWERQGYAPPDLPDLRAALRADLDRELDDPESLTNKFRDLIKPR